MTNDVEVKTIAGSAGNTCGGRPGVDSRIRESHPCANHDVGTYDDILLYGRPGALVEDADGGRIVNLSTSVVGTKLETYSVYAATKAAVETMTAILSKEMRGRHITVNAVAPGPTATDLFLTGKTPELVDRLAQMNPLERLATPADIASVVAFLVGPDGGWINGQVLRANGGMV